MISYDSNCVIEGGGTVIASESCFARGVLHCLAGASLDDHLTVVGEAYLQRPALRCAIRRQLRV